jgi:hypothetical protein
MDDTDQHYKPSPLYQNYTLLTHLPETWGRKAKKSKGRRGLNIPRYRHRIRKAVSYFLGWGRLLLIICYTTMGANVFQPIRLCVVLRRRAIIRVMTRGWGQVGNKFLPWKCPTLVVYHNRNGPIRRINHSSPSLQERYWNLYTEDGVRFRSDELDIQTSHIITERIEPVTKQTAFPIHVIMR